MGRIKKKGTSGQAKNFITRTQAVRKLQISLPDFRRLCIFKGIYPREPRNKKKAFKSSTHSTTFYYTKDIQYLFHEPLLRRFREQKALAKKIARSLGRGEVGDAARLEKQATPRLKLDHIIRERYPTFIDALRDLDDALSILFLFANLPSTTTVPAKTIARCQRLCHEFQHYLIKTHSLKKSFLSIKGIYYQATIQGQDILWLVPYKFVQRVSSDVDYRIMGTFVEFYTTLLGFVNYRLYSSIGLVYPPKYDAESDERGGELDAFTIEGRKLGEDAVAEEEPKALTNGHEEVPAIAQGDVQEIADRVIAETAEQDSEEQAPEDAVGGEEQINDEIDTFVPVAPGGDILPQPQLSSNQAAALFKPFTFFISREAPRQPLEFLLRAFGCERIAWDTVLGDGAFTNDESDPRITHQIVDRPLPTETALPAIPQTEDGEEAITLSVRPGSRYPGRTYIQPQWVWDCANEGSLLRPDIYAPGATLPPHMSPWVKPSKIRGTGAHVAENEEEARTAAAEEDGIEEEEEDEEEEENAEDTPAVKAGKSDNMDVAADSEDIDGGMDIAGSDSEEEDDDEFGGFDDVQTPTTAPQATEAPVEEAEADEDQLLYQRELEAEAAGLPFNPEKERAALKKSHNSKRVAKKEREAQEVLEARKMMMSRRKRKLYEKMVYSNSKKTAEEEKLASKRRKIEKKEKGGKRVLEA